MLCNASSSRPRVHTGCEGQERYCPLLYAEGSDLKAPSEGAILLPASWLLLSGQVFAVNSLMLGAIGCFCIVSRIEVSTGRQLRPA